MKKIVTILSITVIVFICLGYFFEYDSMLRGNLARNFDANIYISSKPSVAKKNIIRMEKIAKKHEISFMKENVIPANSLKDIKKKQKIDLYLYLNDAEWFSKKFSNVKINKNVGGINKFNEVYYSSMLTTKDINFYPYEKLNEESFAGDYRIKGDKNKIDSFIKNLNNSNIGIEAKKVSTSGYPSDLSMEEVNLCIMIFLILFIGLIFSIIIYNGMLLKELSVVALLGHNKYKFCMGKVKNLLAISFVGSFVITNIFLYLLIKPQSVEVYLASVKQIYLLNIVSAFIIAVFEYCIFLFTTRKLNFIKFLNGYRQGYSKLTVVFKTATVTLVIYMLVATLFTIFNYFQVNPSFYKWEKSKNYVNIAFSFSEAVENGPKKLQRDASIKMSDLWDELDKQGALMYYPEVNDKEGISEEEKRELQTDSEKEAVSGDYAYINSNYLNYAKIRDINNNIINVSKLKSTDWIILKPNSMKFTKKDKKLFKEEHAFQTQKKAKLLKEKYITIKDNQTLFSFDSEQKIDAPDIGNKALILVNGRALSSEVSIKESSLTNGKIHPKVKNVAKAFDELKPMISKYNLEGNVLYVTSVYNEVAEELRLFKLKVLVNLIGLLMSLITLISLIKIDISAYFGEHGRRIAVSRLMGFDFISIHKDKLFRSYYVFLLSVAIFMGILVFSMKFGLFSFFSPRSGWQMSDVFACVFIAFIGMVCSFIAEVIGLRLGEKDIAVKLKEGS